MSHLIKNIASSERPYEKAAVQGIEALSDAELLAVVLRTGTRDASSIDLANRILDSHFFHKGLLGLHYIRRQTLLDIKGIGDTKATQILAVAELANRMNRAKLKKELNFNNPDTIALYYMEKCKYLAKERTYLMLLSGSHMLIKELVLSEGTVNAALISPREIFIEALKYEAVNIILVHNHPSGIPEPSEADIEATRKICRAGHLIDIHVSDHIIVGNGCYVSMMERGIIE